MKTFRVGGFELPVYSSFDLTHVYEPLGGETILRACNGRGILQRTWQKTRIVTSGQGWLPSGVQSLDFDAQHVVSCVVAETVPASTLTRSVTLPASRRSDAGHEPFGLAQMPGGETFAVGVSVVGDVATAAELPGARLYQIGYYPQFTCWLLRPQRSGPDPKWELIAEEV